MRTKAVAAGFSVVNNKMEHTLIPEPPGKSSEGCRAAGRSTAATGNKGLSAAAPEVWNGGRGLVAASQSGAPGACPDSARLPTC